MCAYDHGMCPETFDSEMFPVCGGLDGDLGHGTERQRDPFEFWTADVLDFEEGKGSEYGCIDFG